MIAINTHMTTQTTADAAALEKLAAAVRTVPGARYRLLTALVEEAAEIIERASFVEASARTLLATEEGPLEQAWVI